MTLTLTFPPDVEARLRERAAAAGKDVETVVQEALENIFRSKNADAAQLRTHEQWLAEFNAWVSSHQPVSHFVDDSRDSIYAGRGE